MLEGGRALGPTASGAGGATAVTTREARRAGIASGKLAAWRARLAIRAAAALMGLVPLALLALAGSLQPDADGLGTHQQLGLPPCSMRLILGVRCPSCGMTTSWAHFMRGQWAESLAANPGGFLLALYSLTLSSISGVVLWRGRLPDWPLQCGFAVALVAIAAVAVVQWLLRLL